MTSHEQALVSLFSQLALSFDGAVLGLALAYTAVRSVLKLTANSAALDKLCAAPNLSVSDLRSLLDSSDSDGNSQNKLVIVRGTVEAKSSVESGWKSLRPGVLVSNESGDSAVAIERSQTVPFVLIDGGRRSHADYAIVNLEGSRHPLPLTTVYHKLQPTNASPYTFLQALFGNQYPVGILDEEKILPLGKDVYAVGICYYRNGIAEIKSCKELPYFLSELNKDQMIVELTFKSKVLFWSGIILGSLSIGILGYAFMRNWNKWKQWRQQREAQQQRQVNHDDAEFENLVNEMDDVPDGQLCVICLMRRRRSVFIPCGHLVCCQGCAVSVERNVAPKCPVCRQEIRNSVRIFES
ncbi:hypothetical protein QN277_024018 [Acacia crassicarpa]|uniref:RING-type E3 ubiquitin transferase n=1 Tax=Acacia crassicarpa TaxID=499986 RepID=A0AAE1MJP3_9FABA|nr:hypothetical protein QN277_024018 [Acacia crassicarpa]